MRKFLQMVGSKVSAARAVIVKGAFAVLGSFGMAAAMLPAPAHAALTLDSASILADIATAGTFITVVGLAVLGLVFVAKAIKYARRAG